MYPEHSSDNALTHRVPLREVEWGVLFIRFPPIASVGEVLLLMLRWRNSPYIMKENH